MTQSEPDLHGPWAGWQRPSAASAGLCAPWGPGTTGGSLTRSHTQQTGSNLSAPTAGCYHGRLHRQAPPPTLEVTTSLEAWEGLRRGRDGDRGAGCTLVLPPRHPGRLRLCLRRSPGLGQSSQRDGRSDASWVPGCCAGSVSGWLLPQAFRTCGEGGSSYVGSGRDRREDCLRPETFQGADDSGPLRPGRATPGQV